MQVTRDVITDLWPVYISGEASPETVELVEAFLKEDPEFAQILRGAAEKALLETRAPSLPPDHEARALCRTKRLMGMHIDWFLFMAMLFSCFAFGRIVSDTSFDVSPRNFIISASIALVFWIAFFVRTFLIRKQVFQIRVK